MAMMLVTTVHWGGDALEKKVIKVAQKTLREISMDLSAKLRNSLRARKGRKSGKSPAGGIPAMWTGRLAKSVTRDNRGLRKNRPWVRVGMDFKEARYAGILEFGGVITSKKKYLTIPLNPEAQKILGDKTGGGLLRSMLQTGELKMTKKDAKGRIWIYKPGLNKKVTGTATSDEFMFLFAKSVRIPAHPFIRPLVNKERAGIIAKMNNAIAKTGTEFDVNRATGVTKWTA